MNKPLITAVLLLMGSLSAALAADAVPRCSGLFDDAQRLACYDAQFGKPVRIASAPQAAPQAAVQVPAVPPREETVTSRITAVSRISNDRFLVTLDNGQKWTQLERDSSVEVQIGDTVKVRPAMLGSWMLETRSGVRTRVRSAR
jgi:hypothetical protein